MMAVFKAPTEEEIQKTNRLQRDFFSELLEVFDPPLPEGVPERLESIVASAKIADNDVVLDVGSGTGILVPLIRAYNPQKIIACDLSETMLSHLKEQYPYVETIASDVRDLELPENSVDVLFMNACYPNIVDKPRSFGNVTRMMTPGGRMIISHPMGRSFIDSLKEKSPFPLDDFPEKQEADDLFQSYGFDILDCVDDPNLYILILKKREPL